MNDSMRRNPLLRSARQGLWLVLIAGALSAQTSAREAYLQARENLVEERFEPALALFRSIVAQYPKSEEADDAQYYVGYTLERLGRKQEAVKAYDELIEKWPDSIRVENARTHRAEIVRYQPQAGGALLNEVFSSPSTSWELKRDTAIALARSVNVIAPDVLEEIMRREASSRQLELVAILSDRTSNPTARRVLLLGLEPSLSTSVQLRALQALAPVAAESEVTGAMARALAGRTSSSVKLQAIQVLAPHASLPNVRRALASALENENGSSVQLAACAALAGHLGEAEIRPAVLRLFEASASSSVQLAALAALDRNRDRPEVEDLLRAAIVTPTSSSVKLQAIRIAGASKLPKLRAVAREGLRPENSTSVQFEAVKAFGEGRNDPAASEALATVFGPHQTSTSVQLAALDALANHLDTPAAAPALAESLEPTRSTSVQLKALGLASPRASSPEIRLSLLRVLGDSSTSTSVQLEAISLLREDVGRPDVRRILAAALRPSNSTSTLLKAVEALASQTAHAEVREAMVRTFTHEYSTSVVLASMTALAAQLEKDAPVKDAFIRLMEDDGMSSTARVRAGRGLSPAADASLKKRIADAMEDVILRVNRRDFGNHGGRVTDDALDVLRPIDPERAARLAERVRWPRLWRDP